MTIEAGRIEVEDLGRRFKLSSTPGRTIKGTLLRRDVATEIDFWALRHVTFHVEPGETFGIIGRNGSGKSTLLKIIARIFGPTEGSCRVGGRVSSLLELGAGFHPEFTAVENIYLASAVYGIPREEVRRDLDEIIGFAEIQDFAHQPIKTFSSGMFMRLGFSIAMHVRPDVLLLDEALAVGDERFVQKCVRRIKDFRAGGGTMLLVTHDPNMVKTMCDRAILLDRGQPIAVGPASNVMSRYHERLQSEQTNALATTSAAATSDALKTVVRVVDAHKKQKDRFEETEPFSVALEIESPRDINNAVIRLAFRDEAGYELGVRFLRDVDFVAGVRQHHELHGVHSPLRDGAFRIEFALLDGKTGAVTNSPIPSAWVSITSHDADHWGPVRIEGSWQNPFHT
jgi:ABC-type polysaccharide/polyol phosphate transport system ATPase subunit